MIEVGYRQALPTSNRFLKQKKPSERLARSDKKSLDLYDTHRERHGHECGWQPVRQHPAVAAAAAPADRWPVRQRLPAAAVPALPALAADRTPGDGHCSSDLQPQKTSEESK